MDQEILRYSEGKAINGIIVNSGCANAVTGMGGIQDAKTMSKECDRVLATKHNLGVAANAARRDGRSLVMSTGVIGQRLPMDRIIPAISTASESLSSSHDSFLRFARAIGTTDTFPKIVSRKFTLPSYPDVEFSMCGTAKGAGMIHPNMATLLGIICTDVGVRPQQLQTLLKQSIDRSFNSITIDGDTSTNDTVAIFANGAAAPGLTPIRQRIRARDHDVLGGIITEVATALAQLVVRDGEGATKFATIRVQGAPSEDLGRLIGRTVAKSPLVKTALYGKDANFGRVLMAMGNLRNIRIVGNFYRWKPEKISVSFASQEQGELKMLVNGELVEGGIDEEKASEILQNEDVEILIKVGDNRTESVVWTCDFSHEYVTINGDYRT